MLAFSMKSDYDEGNSYNWAQWKYFSAELATGMYNRPSSIKSMQEPFYGKELDGNIALLTEQVRNHPETTFIFFFPPYSMLWWDSAYRNGERDLYLYNEQQAIAALLAYDNVEIYYYHDEEEIITNLDNYMYIIQFSKDINQVICDKIITGEGRLTEDNYEERLQNMYDLSERIVNEYILEYYDK